MLLHEFPVLHLPDEQARRNYVSINPFLPDKSSRCHLECAYCVCHHDSEWHHHPEKFSDNVSSQSLLDTLLTHTLSRDDCKRYPLSLYDFTDPFLAAHRADLLQAIRSLSQHRVKNSIYITTKIHPGEVFLKQLQATLHDCHELRMTVFVSLAPLKPGYETISVQSRIQLLLDLARLHIPAAWYLRPLTEAWFDESKMWTLTRALFPEYAQHTVLSNVVMSPEIETALQSKKLITPQWDREHSIERQELSPNFELHVRSILRIVADELGITLGPVMPHRQCGVFGHHNYGCLGNHYWGVIHDYR